MAGLHPQAHFLPRNHASWAPAAVVCLDSETVTSASGADELETLRCWTAQMTRRRHRRRAGEISRAEGTTQPAVAAAVDGWASEDKSTWLFAHNVGFDLVTTRLPAELAALGWELSSRHAVTGSAPWIILHKGKYTVRERDNRTAGAEREERVKWQHTLTVADSFSIMPVPLAVLADASGIPKPPLPHRDAPADEWIARCWADTRILSWAILTLMTWWEDNDLGKWSVSGAACAWNSYRHTLDDRDVVIDPQRPAIENEHQACYGGKRHVFRCGQLPAGRYAELDFRNAYAVIAATQPLPRKRMGRLTPQLARQILGGQSRYGMLARVTVTTDVPRWPLRARGRVFYPVGQFTTVLADPDLKDAHARGALAAVHDGWFYSLSNHMAPWAERMLAIYNDAGGEHPEPARIWAKGASRSGCGKWAQRGWSTIPYPGPPGDDWTFEDVWVAGRSAPASVVGLAGTYWLSVADQEGSHEFPAVLAWIESHTRVRLNALLDILPPGAAIQCDTDGAMASVTQLDGAAARGIIPDYRQFPPGERLDALAEWLSAYTAPLQLRVKREFRAAVVYGPQHVVIDGEPRFSGVPRSARPDGAGRWSARLWPGLAWQIEHGTRGSYVRPVQDYLIVGPYAHGWVLDDGAVMPVEAADDQEGTAHLLPWDQTRWAAAGARLAPAQAGWAGGLWRQP